MKFEAKQIFENLGSTNGNGNLQDKRYMPKIRTAKTKRRKVNQGVLRAVEVAGSQMALADLLGVRQPAVFRWLYSNVTPERAKEIEDATGVPRGLIRPDIFGE